MDDLDLEDDIIEQLIFSNNISMNKTEVFSSPAYSPDTTADSHGNVQLLILEQPASQLRFRYLSELQGTPHGPLQGENSTKTNKTFPKVQLTGYQGDDAFIRCWLVDGSNLEDPRPHIHDLVVRRQKRSNDVDYDPHIRKVGYANHHTTSFEDMVVLHAVTTNKETRNRYLNKVKLWEGRMDDPENISSSPSLVLADVAKLMKGITKNVVHLYFEAVVESHNGFRLLASCISNPIKNMKDRESGELKIMDQSLHYGTNNGGDVVFLFTSKLPSKFRIVFTDDTGWEGVGEFQPSDVHLHCAVKFRTPQYPGSGSVYFRIIRETDSLTSNVCTFKYLNEDTITTSATSSRKRPSKRIKEPVVKKKVPRNTSKAQINTFDDVLDRRFSQPVQTEVAAQPDIVPQDMLHLDLANVDLNHLVFQEPAVSVSFPSSDQEMLLQDLTPLPHPNNIPEFGENVPEFDGPCEAGPTGWPKIDDLSRRPARVGGGKKKVIAEPQFMPFITPQGMKEVFAEIADVINIVEPINALEEESSESAREEDEVETGFPSVEGVFEDIYEIEPPIMIGFNSQELINLNPFEIIRRARKNFFILLIYAYNVFVAPFYTKNWLVLAILHAALLCIMQNNLIIYMFAALILPCLIYFNKKYNTSDIFLSQFPNIKVHPKISKNINPIHFIILLCCVSLCFCETVQLRTIALLIFGTLLVGQVKGFTSAKADKRLILLDAVCKHDVDAIKLLPDQYWYSEFINDALCRAVYDQWEEGVKLLIDIFKIEDSAAIQMGPSNLIHVAVRNLSAKCVELILSGSSNALFLKDSDGKTALHIAVEECNYTKIELLLQISLKENLREEMCLTTDNEGNTPLHAAVISKINTKCFPFLAIIGDVDRTNYKGLTALHLAVLNKQMDSVVKLLQMGANPETTHEMECDGNDRSIFSLTDDEQIKGLLKRAIANRNRISELTVADEERAESIKENWELVCRINDVSFLIPSLKAQEFPHKILLNYLAANKMNPVINVTDYL